MEPGVCPRCGGDLEYGTSEPVGNSLFYECSCPACGFSGKEWYLLTFTGYSDENNDVM